MGKADTKDVLLEANPTISFRNAMGTRKLPWYKMLTVVYIFFLCWQLIAMCLYMVRAVTCFKQQLPTYLCDANAGFIHSVEIQVLWLITRCLQLTIAIVILPKIADFPGYIVVLRRLKTMPQFWQLLFLLLTALSRHVVLFVVSEPKTKLHTSVVFFYALVILLRAIAVGVLNYTHLNSLKKQPTKNVFVFYKLTLVVIFIDNVFRFMISLMALFMGIQDFGHRENNEDSPEVLAVFLFLEKFGTTLFHFTIMNFFWKKLFDYKNALSIHYNSHII